MRLTSAMILIFLLLAGTSSAEATCVESHLKPLRCVRGRIIDPSGAAVPHVTVTVLKNEAEIAATQTGEDGAFSFDGLKAGDYDLHAAAFGFALFRFPIVLENPKKKCGRMLEITLALGLESCDGIRLVKH
jgi:hypothetical protein